MTESKRPRFGYKRVRFDVDEDRDWIRSPGLRIGTEETYANVRPGAETLAEDLIFASVRLAKKRTDQNRITRPRIRAKFLRN